MYAPRVKIGGPRVQGELPRGPIPQARDRRHPRVRVEMTCVRLSWPRGHEDPAYLTVLNRLSISAQLTTFHQAAMYSARRFWYLR